MAKKKAKPYVAARRMMPRDSGRRLGSKVFSYYLPEERDLLDQACAITRRSLSSFTAEAALEKAREVIAAEERKSKREKGRSRKTR